MPVTSTNKKAFSVIELIVVVAIIGILSGIIIPNLSSSRAKARDAQRISDVGQIQFAIQLYYDRCGQYPNTLVLSASNGCPSGVTLNTFIAQIPTPPAGAEQTVYDYSITPTSGSVINYVIHAILEQYNVAILKGLSGFPSSGTWSATYTCSNSSSSTNYCVTSN